MDFSFSYWVSVPLSLTSDCIVWQFLSTGVSSTQKLDGSELNVELWPRILIQRCIVVQDHNSTLNCDPAIIQCCILTPCNESTLNYDPGSKTRLIPRWIIALSHASTINCNPRSRSPFNKGFWPGVTFQRGNLTRGSYSIWNSYPFAYLQLLEFLPKKMSKFNSVLKIQNSTAKEGHNSTKNPLNVDRGSVLKKGGGGVVLSYSGSAPYLLVQ